MHRIYPVSGGFPKYRTRIIPQRGEGKPNRSRKPPNDGSIFVTPQLTIQNKRQLHPEYWQSELPRLPGILVQGRSSSLGPYQIMAHRQQEDGHYQAISYIQFDGPLYRKVFQINSLSRKRHAFFDVDWDPQQVKVTWLERKRITPLIDYAQHQLDVVTQNQYPTD